MAALGAEGIRVRNLTARFSAYPPRGLSRLAWLPATLLDATVRALAASRADVCLLQRELVSTLRTAEPLIRPPIVFDVDDAIFLGPRGSLSDLVARRAAVTVCGNRFLAEHYGTLGRVVVLPTAVDTERFVPTNSSTPSRPTIGWSGTSSGFKFLYGIEEALSMVLRQHPDAVIKIVADKPPSFQTLPRGRVRFERWTPEREVQAIQDFTIGLMPLEDSPWARGKCSFKMLTYMAVGVPAVVSPVGMNREVLELGPCGHAANCRDEWVDAISDVLRNTEKARAMGATGRAIVTTHFSRTVIAPRLGDILKAVAHGQFEALSAWT